MRVRALAATGRLVVIIARPDSDTLNELTVRSRADGKVTTKLENVTNRSRNTLECGAATASWSADDDQVKVSVPQSCLNLEGFLSRHWVEGRLSRNGVSDEADARVVGRGDTPGCVTRSEFRAVKRGQRMGVVHARLDTAGRFGDGGAGGFSRLYRVCDGGNAYAIEYNGHTGRVAGKFRL